MPLNRVDDGANVLLAAVAIDLPLDAAAADHYTKAGHDLLGPRIANAIGYYYGKSQYYRGPTLTSATYPTSAHDVIEVQVQHHRHGAQHRGGERDRKE